MVCEYISERSFQKNCDHINGRKTLHTSWKYDFLPNDKAILLGGGGGLADYSDPWPE